MALKHSLSTNSSKLWSEIFCHNLDLSQSFRSIFEMVAAPSYDNPLISVTKAILISAVKSYAVIHFPVILAALLAIWLSVKTFRKSN